MTGLRGSLGPAFVLRRLRRRERLRRLSYALVIGELIADKLPRTPDRTRALGLAPRAAFGALIAAFTRPRRGPVAGAAALLLGALTAVASAFVGVRLRRGLTNLLGGGPIANVAAGALEDAGAVSLVSAIAPSR